MCTDRVQTLTQGNPIGPLAVLTHLQPSMGVYTAVALPRDGSKAVIGQVKYVAGRRSARLAFLMPDDFLDHSALPLLLDHLAVKAGQWGAFHVLAEVDEGDSLLEILRRAGYAVYAWQRIWQFGVAASAQNNKIAWQPATSLDEIAIRSLYQALVPPLVQSAEPINLSHPQGWIYRQDGEILAYVEGNHGPHGIVLHPLIHPAVENVSQVMQGLLARQSRWFNRPVYLAVRSYQAWLETILRDLECQVGERQALMVKRLAVQQRVSVTAPRHLVLENYGVESTLPIAHHSLATIEGKIRKIWHKNELRMTCKP